jgi:phosphohistidine phosphatase
LRRLTLMRHGDAHWKDPGLPDIERPLSRRGNAAAEAMGRRLLELELVPDLLLMSPAKRTLQTAEIVARELSMPQRLLRREDALYLASAADILKVVQGTGPRVEHLMVVTHNPGVSELIQQLAGDAAGGGMGTAAVCSMTFEAADWGQLGSVPVRDVRHESPPRKLFGLFS